MAAWRFASRSPFLLARRCRSIKKNLDWIQKRRESLVKLSLIDGEKLTLFGKEYRIQSGNPKIEEETIFLSPLSREENFKKLLKKLSLEKMSALTEKIAQKEGFSYHSIKISSARSRWGSCSREGNISYSFRVAFLTPELFEYVAVHELSHTRFFDHGKKFWECVERILPDYKKRRKELSEAKIFDF